MHNWPKSGYVLINKNNHLSHIIPGIMVAISNHRLSTTFRRGWSMVVVLETVARPMVQVAFCRDGSQLPLWDSRLDYEHSSLALRLLAFGVVITCEGLYICSELAPFEQHPIVRRVLSEPELLKRRRRRAKLLEGWGKAAETATIDRAAHLIGNCPSIFREKLSDILKQPLPTVSKYSLDGGRTWRWLAMESPRPMLDDVRVA